MMVKLFIDQASDMSWHRRDGAPKYGDKAGWADRMNKGTSTLEKISSNHLSRNKNDAHLNSSIMNIFFQH